MRIISGLFKGKKILQPKDIKTRPLKDLTKESIFKKNLENLKFLKNYTILEKNIYEDNFFLNLNMNFDLIFLDPPYKDKNLDKLLLKIRDGKILNKNGIIVLHRHKKEADIIPLSLKILEEKKYGISKITFLSILN